MFFRIYCYAGNKIRYILLRQEVALDRDAWRHLLCRCDGNVPTQIGQGEVVCIRFLKILRDLTCFLKFFQFSLLCAFCDLFLNSLKKTLGFFISTLYVFVLILSVFEYLSDFYLYMIFYKWTKTKVCGLCPLRQSTVLNIIEQHRSSFEWATCLHTWLI